MLTPSDLQAIANDITDIYSGVESECIKSIVDHITSGKRITQASVWQMKKLNDVGILRRDLVGAIKKQTGKSFPEVEALIQQSLERSLGVDTNALRYAMRAGNYKEKIGNKAEFIASVKSSEAFQKILHSATAGCKDIINLTNTRAVQASIKAYTDAINIAYLEMATGNYTFDEAVQRAVGRIGKSGIKIVDSKDKATNGQLVDKNGTKYTTYADKAGGVRVYPLDSAIRRDLTTTINRSCGALTLESCDDMGCELVETSWHIGARPEHELWQGRIFSLNPKDTRYPYFYAPQEAGGTGYGDILGLCGINCYHSFNPYFEGSPRSTQENKPTKAENEKAYREQQQQRYYERSLRSLKREQLAYQQGGFTEKAQQTQRRINELSAKYKQFLSDTGRTRVSMLDKVSGYRRISTKPTATIPNPTATAPRTPVTPRTPTAQHVVPKVPTPTLDNYDKHLKDFATSPMNVTDYNRVDEKNFKQCMTNAFNLGQPSMRIDESVLDKITSSDGRFKTQMETQRSGGCFNPDLRRRTTTDLFGATGLKDNQYEKYGCLLSKNYEEAFDSGIARWYGNSIVQFKPDVLERTTFSIGDSLGIRTDHVPSKVADKNIHSIANYRVRNYEDLSKLATATKFNDISHGLTGDYIELQYHGDLTLEDIQSICFGHAGYHERKTIDTLKNHGIKVYEMTSSGLKEL